MNVLMLGNGFDIHYRLLTKYINFINTVVYISTVITDDAKTVGDILKAPKLQIKDKDVAESYYAYQQAYDNTVLEEGLIEKLSSLANNNLFFSFLLTSFNRDVGWIDFEKEIAKVISAFKSFLKADRTRFSSSNFPESAGDRYIIRQFCFFYQPADPRGGSTKIINAEYIKEEPYGSNLKVIDKEKVIEELEKQLLELVDCLRLYLKCFVDNVVNELLKLQYLQKIPALSGANKVITFNYTNTYEQLYSCEKVYHIHGDVHKNIILGINPDNADEISTIDISFLRFKKYFQRIVYHSDDEYLEWITNKHNCFYLVVMGHSLDVTDEDVIMQVFEAAKDITILFHNESAQIALVSNLINIYGKERFDELRIKKRLRLLPLNATYNSFAEDRQTKKDAEIASAIFQHARSFDIGTAIEVI